MITGFMMNRRIPYVTMATLLPALAGRLCDGRVDAGITLHTIAQRSHEPEPQT